MTGRTLAITLAACGCGLATPCLAQGYAAPGEVVTLPAEAGGYGYSSGAFGDVPGYGGATPAGYAGGPAYCPPDGGYAQVPCEPRPACWWKPRPLFIGPKLLKPPRNSFVRLEYLLWEIEEPGDVPLGAPLIEDPSDVVELFPTTDNTATDGFFLPQQGRFGYVPRLDEIQLRDNSGIRLTLGIPTYEYGTFELSGWMLEQASDSFEFGPRELIPGFVGIIPGVPFSPAVPQKTDLATGRVVGPFAIDSVAVYDTLDAEYSSDLWGADAEFVVDALAPQGEGLKFRPLFGFKYVGFQESLYQRGRFIAPGLSFGSSVNSDTYNTILGGTIGLRTELEHRWFVLGVQPAVTFAGNISEVTVATERVGGPNDPRREVSSDYFDFCPILDLNAYARVCVTENIR
ncbi:MAG TPA: BBP7 family outer membrane beta-barrel protein, partial [Planctomycetaceae bacterium]